MAITLSHKFEADVEIMVSAEKFYDMFTNRPHHVTNASADKIQACELHEGSFGVVGAICTWSYFHDGKARKVKDRVEAVDPDKNMVTYKVIEGDLKRNYKNFLITIQVTNKSDGTGSIAHWTLEYEKLHDGVSHPETFLHFLIDLCKDVESHLIKGY